MTNDNRNRNWWLSPLAVVWGAVLLVSGCTDPVAQSVSPELPYAPPIERTSDADQNRGQAPEAAENASAPADSGASTEDPARPRQFVAEGPEGALRISFDDLDLQKLINMENVTPDCVEKMPQWLKDLTGKPVRIRGYMKPISIPENIPEFPLVRSTDMCCFGPKGKVYHMALVSLKPGTTTDYIELRPFDVVGQFRIEMVQNDDLIILLYHLDDAKIVRR
jgi:hypothetical protein